MKETGLMFKADLVRAILNRQKTQTRRVVKPQPVPGQGMVNAAYCGDRHLWLRDGPCDVSDPTYEWRCPFGKLGDRIYVRETFGYGGDAYTPDIYFRASQSDAPIQGRWYPAIHMRKADARIWLEITDVRVERLQTISRGDAMAEGCPFPNIAGGRDPREWFEELWNTTGGDWSANPWVWVIDFKRIDKP